LRTTFLGLFVAFMLQIAFSSVASAETAESLTEDWQVPGSAHIVFAEQEIISEGYFGTADLNVGSEVSSKTLFYLHSLSKPVFATAAILLAKENRIDFDAKISDILPEMKLHCQGVSDPRCGITVRHLLTHTSGYDYPSALAGKRDNSENYDTGFFFNPIGDLNSLESIGPNVFVDLALKAKLNHAPGEGFTYGISYDLLGYVFEEVTGEKLENILKHYVFSPLGMKNTFFAPANADHDGLVRLYNRKYATYPIPGRYMRYQDYDQSRVLITRDDYPTSAGGGLIGTARDYVIFLQGVMSLFSGQLTELDRDYLYCSQIPENLGTSPLKDSFFAADHWSYSFGFGVLPSNREGLCSDKLFWAGYSNNQFVVDLREGKGEIFLTNLFPLDHNISIALDAVR
jgi:CubicO group peptidase (beta-lactamase class C family)